MNGSCGPYDLQIAPSTQTVHKLRYSSIAPSLQRSTSLLTPYNQFRWSNVFPLHYVVLAPVPLRGMGHSRCNPINFAFIHNVCCTTSATCVITATCRLTEGHPKDCTGWSGYTGCRSSKESAKPRNFAVLQVKSLNLPCFFFAPKIFLLAPSFLHRRCIVGHVHRRCIVSHVLAKQAKQRSWSSCDLGTILCINFVDARSLGASKTFFTIFCFACSASTPLGQGTESATFINLDGNNKEQNNCYNKQRKVAHVHLLCPFLLVTSYASPVLFLACPFAARSKTRNHILSPKVINKKRRALQGAQHGKQKSAFCTLPQRCACFACSFDQRSQSTASKAEDGKEGFASSDLLAPCAQKMHKSSNLISINYWQWFNQKSEVDFLIRKKNSSRIRPLLLLNRFDIGKLCIYWQLPVYPDKSNQKLHFLRNRVRKQLIPIIKIFFNSRIEHVLLQFAEIFSAEDSYMNQITSTFFKKLTRKNTTCLPFTSSLCCAPCKSRLFLLITFGESTAKDHAKSLRPVQPCAFTVPHALSVAKQDRRSCFAQQRGKQKVAQYNLVQPNFSLEKRLDVLLSPKVLHVPLLCCAPCPEGAQKHAKRGVLCKGHSTEIEDSKQVHKMETRYNTQGRVSKVSSAGKQQRRKLIKETRLLLALLITSYPCLAPYAMQEGVLCFAPEVVLASKQNIEDFKEQAKQKKKKSILCTLPQRCACCACSFDQRSQSTASKAEDGKEGFASSDPLAPCAQKMHKSSKGQSKCTNECASSTPFVTLVKRGKQYHIEFIERKLQVVFAQGTQKQSFCAGLAF